MAAVGTNALYVPAKMLYALVGGVTGGVGYALTGGNLESAHAIWSPTLSGTWVITPEMLQGRQPILISGESYDRVAEGRVEYAEPAPLP